MTHHKISASTLARTAALALALTNQVLSAVGKPMLPIESAQLEQLISSGLTVAAALASWWNNFLKLKVSFFFCRNREEVFHSSAADPLYLSAAE